MLTSVPQQQIQPSNTQDRATYLCGRQGSIEQPSFAGRTVTTLDRTLCEPEKDLELVQLVNNAYGHERINSEDKYNPTRLYFCLTENRKLLSCAGYFRGDKAETKVAKLEETDCYITPFAALKGHGYGTILLKGIEEKAKELGFKKLVFDVWNEAPLDMNPYYARYGCEKGDTVEYMSQGNTYTMTRYTKALSALN